MIKKYSFRRIFRRYGKHNKQDILSKELCDCMTLSGVTIFPGKRPDRYSRKDFVDKPNTFNPNKMS
jgi:hypothetical protein